MPTNHDFVTLDVFTDRVFGGNPLAVLAPAEGLTSESMQAIAREFNLSETTFVLPPENPTNTHKVRIFTPVAELDFAGHPTLGTAIALALDDLDESNTYTFSFEEGAGVVPVSVSQGADGLMRAELSVAMLPEKQKDEALPETWAQILGLDQTCVCPNGQEIGTWTCGAPFTFVPVSDLDALQRAVVDTALWDQHLARSTTTGVFVFTQNTGAPNADVRARMFAPAHGIAEDPATGSAVAALAGWLAADTPLPNGLHTWTVEQGVEMGRPSRLELAADMENGSITGVRVAGSAVPVSRGSITLP